MILLIQFRRDQSGWHELKCFYESLDLSYNQIQIINAGSETISSKEILSLARKSKGIIIGGLGETGYGEINVEKKFWFNNIREKMVFVLKKIIKKNQPPVLGICFGHQLLAESLGAKVDFSPKQAETGVTKIHLTKEGMADPLFKGFNSMFLAIEGHKDAVLNLPKKSLHLAYSHRCLIQAFRYKKFFYGLQFHPELNYKDFLFRLSLYPDYQKQKTVNQKPIVKTKLIFKNFLFQICDLRV
ncbi:MAG: type 1 glutamine amidotransferase [Microgenomates group bacterium]|nr:type 1 glutamine amidotransferase [Microgenomates group bacterium]